MSTVAAAFVPAGAFRAYVSFLVEAAGVPWAVVAQKAGVPVAAVTGLFAGRDGRRRRYLDRATAIGLLEVTPANLRALRRFTVDATPAQRRILQLRQGGATRADVARRLQIDADEVRRLELGFQSRCLALTDALARAAVTGPPGGQAGTG